MNLPKLLQQGATRVRREAWKHPDAHLRLVENVMGPQRFHVEHDSLRQGPGSVNMDQIDKIYGEAEDWEEYSPTSSDGST